MSKSDPSMDTRRTARPRNLIWTCRSCNVHCAYTLKRPGLGRPTHQYNPAKSEGAGTLGQWMNAVMSIKGNSGGTMSVSDAVSLIHPTPLVQRSQFAREIWAIRRRRGSDGIVPF